MDTQEFHAAVKDIYIAVERLRRVFPGRKFTPDGRMLGDIGEAIAAMLYKIDLDEKSQKDWDGCWNDRAGNKRRVQIRATQGETTYLKKPPFPGTLLIFKIDKEKHGEYKMVYNGNIGMVWNKIKNQKSKTISIKELINLQKNVEPGDMIPKRK